MRDKAKILDEHRRAGADYPKDIRERLVLEALLDVRDSLLVMAAAASGTPFVFGEDAPVPEKIVASISDIVDKVRSEENDS